LEYWNALILSKKPMVGARRSRSSFAAEFRELKAGLEGDWEWKKHEKKARKKLV
jgi:hypothetical protein